MIFKFAASDFDGTLYRNLNISAADLAAIRAWRAAGNVFGIVTGRAIVMLEPLLKSFALDVDFMICDNGAIIYDGGGRIVFESELPKKILLDIINEPCMSRSLHFLFETADKIFCSDVKKNSWVVREKNRWNFPLTFVDTAQIDGLPKVNQLALGFESPEEAQIATDALNRKFGDTIHAQRNTHSVDVVSAGINKAQGVENLLRLMNWQDAEIFVIGDEANDLPMIKHFGGCTVTTAKDYVKREAKYIFDSVGTMLKTLGDCNVTDS